MSGTFASIEKKQLGDNLYIAIKKYSRNHGSIVIRHCKREVHALKKLDVASLKNCLEQHVIQLIEYKEMGVYCCLSLPFFCKTLSNELPASGDSTLAHDFLNQIAKGLKFIHDKYIVHCDLSPANILMDEFGHMVICDFGCAHSINNDIQQEESSDKNEIDEIGTRYYKAPEHLFGSKQYEPSTDIWSLGTIFCEILIGRPIFAGESDIEQIGIIVRSLGKPSAQVEDEEMSRYPDTNKLSFFSFPLNDSDLYSDEDEEDEEDEEEEEGERETDSSEISDGEFDSDESSIVSLPPSRSLKSTLELEEIGAVDQEIVLKILTWSIKERLTIHKVLYFLQFI